mgnify:CR=1 FL=1
MILTCLTTILLNITDIPYNDQDFKTMKVAQRTCSKRYNSCLKNFQKREQGVYRVLCGDKEEFDAKALDNAEMSAIMNEIGHNSVEVQKELLKQIGR